MLQHTASYEIPTSVGHNTDIVGPGDSVGPGDIVGPGDSVGPGKSCGPGKSVGPGLGPVFAVTCSEQSAF